jgi:hypothetical protein
MSDYVVHFTCDTDRQSAYHNMLAILGSGTLCARSAFGIARRKAPSARSQQAVCFSEIPLHLVSRLAAQRGAYGIGFTKAFLIERGGAPVWYVERGSPTANAVNQLVNLARLDEATFATHVWAITPFVDSPGHYPNGSYRFEWEREWRHLGDLRFSTNDPAFLIIPDKLHAAARRFFDEACKENSGPCYDCPLLDPYWTKESIKSAMDLHP